VAGFLCNGSGTTTITKNIQSSNLTPDVTTGLGSWSVAQIVAAIKTGKDDMGRASAPLSRRETEAVTGRHSC